MMMLMNLDLMMMVLMNLDLTMMMLMNRDLGSCTGFWGSGICISLGTKLIFFF